MKYKCKLCNYEWKARVRYRPKTCPRCKRHDWYKRKKNGGRK